MKRPAIVRHEGKIVHVFLRSCTFHFRTDTPRGRVVHCWRAFDAKGNFIKNLLLSDEGVVWAHGRSKTVLEAISKLVESAT